MMSSASLTHAKGWQRSFQASMKRRMAATKSATLGKLPRRTPWRGRMVKPGSPVAAWGAGSAVVMKRALELGEWRLRASHEPQLGGHLFDAIVPYPKRPRRRLR